MHLSEAARIVRSLGKKRSIHKSFSYYSSGSGGGINVGGLSGRSVLNVQDFSFGTNEYAFIDHFRNGASMVGPFSIAFATGPTFPSLIDANGWPNNASASGSAFGGGFDVPDPVNFGGPYTMDFVGNGAIAMNLQGGPTATWTTSSPVNCSVTFNSGGTLQITGTGGAATASIQISFTSTGSGPQTIAIQVQSTGISGFFIKNIRWYRTADASDLANGLIFRRAWKQPIVNNCPSAIRWMDNLGGNNDRCCRWENRTLPSNAGYLNQCQWTSSPSYSTNASGTNQYTVVAATPTGTNTQNTPASMVHGEIATVRFTNGFDRTNNSLKITGVTNVANGVVTTSAPAGLSSLSWASGTVTGVMFGSGRFIVGDVIQLLISGATPAGYNGTFTCTVTAVSPGVSTTFTYPLVTNPGSSPAGGSPTMDGHGYNTGDVIGHYMPLIANTSGTLNGTTTVSSINNASIAVGMFVYGPGIQAGTTVSAINSGANTITLSLAATISANVGLAFQAMKNLHQFPCTITVTSPTQYQLNVDTTNFGTFSANSTPVSYQFVTVQVGSGNDRVAYPFTFCDGNTPASLFGQYVVANDYKTLYFDKVCSAKTDGSGNPVAGAWMMSATPGNNNVAHSGDFPIEICVALINELNAMAPAHTIGLWINIPAWSLCSMDPNYSTTSDFALNMIDVVMNPSSSVRASGYSALGYSGLIQLNTPNVIVEYSNELWNGSGNDARGWLTQRSFARWGNAIKPYSDFQDLKALRSTQMVRAIKAANPPGLSRIKFVLGMWATFGLPITGGDGAGNYPTVFGGNVTANPIAVGDFYTNDNLVTGGNWGRPIDNHDGICPATYFDPPDSYYSTTTGTGTFIDDSAMYNGLNNTGNGGGNYVGAANPTQAITNFVAKVTDFGNTGGGQSIYLYQNVLMPQFASTLPAGKVVINYEGGTDWQTQAGTNQAGHTLTTGEAAFSTAVIASSQWATAQVNFFNKVNSIAKCFMPSIFLMIAPRWGYCSPDSYALSGGVPTEGQALLNSATWVAMGNRNQALPN